MLTKRIKVTEMKKYHIEKNSVQETLVIPLYGRKVCRDHFPQLFEDREAERICSMLDYDFREKGKAMESMAGLFGALEVAQRHYDLLWEIRDYLKKHPEAAVVNLGCGLDDSFAKADNGQCCGYNIDFPEVIAIRNELLGQRQRETNIGCDLNDQRWMDQIDGRNGAIFFAAGVFYYLKTAEVIALTERLNARFPKGLAEVSAVHTAVVRKAGHQLGLPDDGAPLRQADKAGGAGADALHRDSTGVILLYVYTWG